MALIPYRFKLYLIHVIFPLLRAESDSGDEVDGTTSELYTMVFGKRCWSTGALQDLNGRNAERTSRCSIADTAVSTGISSAFMPARPKSMMTSVPSARWRTLLG